MTNVLEKLKKSILGDYDYDQKIRHLSLKKRINWFIINKPNMLQTEKWEAFNDMLWDYDVDRSRLIEMINREIRKRGLSVWDE